MTWWIIINPSAGMPGELVQRTRRSLQNHGIEHEIVRSDSPEHVADIVTQGKRAGITRFGGVGGDGTAHLIVNALMAHKWATPPGLAILPAGSGSDFIRTFALPRKLESAAAHLATPNWYTCDLLQVDGGFGRRFALNVVELGVGAAAVNTARAMPRWIGERRYAIAFWLTLPRFRPGEVKATVDEQKEISGPAIALIVANGQFFGGGMNIAPRASVADGAFDLQVFAGPRRKAFTVMPRIIRGVHLTHKNVRRVIGTTAQIDVPDDWPVEADGEVLGTGSISVSVRPGAIEFKI